MYKVSEERIDFWARVISDTEDDRCKNAVSMAKDAIRKHFGNSVEIIRQGSYENETNIRADSDVDIVVIHGSHYYYDLGQTSQAGKLSFQKVFIEAPNNFMEFKFEIEKALRNEFGGNGVERKNKCLRVPGNTYRVHADVVPAYRHRLYNYIGDVAHLGIGFDTDVREKIVSFPEQHVQQADLKHKVTNQGYKAVVRILKNVRNELVGEGLLLKGSMSSFFIECLVWNATKECFVSATHRENSMSVSYKVAYDMSLPGLWSTYTEVNGIKSLFGSDGAQRAATAQMFMLKALNYLGEEV